MRKHNAFITVVGALSGGVAAYLAGGLAEAVLWAVVGAVVGLMIGRCTPSVDVAASVTIGIVVGGVLGGRVAASAFGMGGVVGKLVGGAIVGLLVGSLVGTAMRTAQAATGWRREKMATGGMVAKQDKEVRLMLSSPESPGVRVQSREEVILKYATALLHDRSNSVKFPLTSSGSGVGRRGSALTDPIALPHGAPLR